MFRGAFSWRHGALFHECYIDAPIDKAEARELLKVVQEKL